MCGITGLYSSHLSKTAREEIVTRMATALHYRGPDDGGVWSSAGESLSVAHRRLSILDLSASGHQPMHSASGRYTVVYNGEIYNFRELKGELQGFNVRFRGESDTEVLLAAIEHWGIEAALERCNGMFAFGVWDGRERTLTLVRDRLGIKPLYYGWIKGGFAFSSELKPLRHIPDAQLEVNRNSLALFTRFSYIPAPWSIYSGIFKLPPGSGLTLSSADLLRAPEEFSPFPVSASEARERGSIYSYWSAEDVVSSAVDSGCDSNELCALDELDRLATCAVERRLVADVPLGAFLSGGVDSSLIVALMQKLSATPVKTFSIGFYEDSFNEAVYAQQVATHLGTDHTEMYVSAQQALDIIPRMASVYDEPFADASQIPTYLLSELTRQHVTVSLSGDGGDELFCGYTRYHVLDRIWKVIGNLPPAVNRGLGAGLRCIPRSLWKLLFTLGSSALPDKLKLHNAAAKAHRLADVLQGGAFEEFYYNGVSHWCDGSQLVPGSDPVKSMFHNHDRLTGKLSGIESMMFYDLVTYLPDDILVKVDRASMVHSLEARVPFLDHEFVEFAWSLPQHMRVRGGDSKWALKQVLYRYVPEALLDRPKMGFGIPHGEWLRGPLREWAEELLDERRLREEGYFNFRLVRDKWDQHIEKIRDWEYYIWDILMFQSWLEDQRLGV